MRDMCLVRAGEMGHKYRQISITDELYNEIRAIIEEDGTYASVSEFVREAVRNHLRRKADGER